MGGITYLTHGEYEKLQAELLSLRSRLFAAEAELDAADQDVKIGKAQREEIIERARAAEQERDEAKADNETLAVIKASLEDDLAAAEGEVERLKAEREEAYDYGGRLFNRLAPQCEPLSDMTGLMTQLDNYIAGLRLRNQELVAALEKIAVMPCLRDLLGDDYDCGCFACIARAALRPPSEETR